MLIFLSVIFECKLIWIVRKQPIFPLSLFILIAIKCIDGYYGQLKEIDPIL